MRFKNVKTGEEVVATTKATIFAYSHNSNYEEIEAKKTTKKETTKKETTKKEKTTDEEQEETTDEEKDDNVTVIE